jgi:alpha-mannosidase
LNVENKNIIVETIKRSEDGKSTIIRLYNNSKAKQVSEIAFCYDFKEIHLTDLLENKLQKQKISDGKIILEFKPYEIHTLCLE